MSGWEYLSVSTDSQIGTEYKIKRCI